MWHLLAFIDSISRQKLFICLKKARLDINRKHAQCLFFWEICFWSFIILIWPSLKAKWISFFFSFFIYIILLIFSFLHILPRSEMFQANDSQCFIMSKGQKWETQKRNMSVWLGKRKQMQSQFTTNFEFYFTFAIL